MVDLSKLNVSLTKHGAHKIAELIKKFDIKEVLNHVDDENIGIHIDLAQAAKNLSVSKRGIIPMYWKEIKKAGDVYINHAVLFAIIFSHHRLILAMQRSKSRFGTGIVKRDEIVEGKEYTNFACIFRELGFIANQDVKYFEYDFSSVFNDKSHSRFIKKIINDKLAFAGKRYSEDLIEVCIQNNFNLVFGLNQYEFQNWLTEEELITDSYDPDLDHDFDEPEDIEDFSFEPGHLERKTDKIKIKRHKRFVEVNNLHNKIQNELYKDLAKKFGEKCVGTENNTGFNPKIDLVVKEGTNFTFYEIKTDNSLRKCIRYAFSQLLEYAYWPDKIRSNKLVIVSPNKISENAKKYLRHMRKTFQIPIYYQQYVESDERFENML